MALSGKVHNGAGLMLFEKFCHKSAIANITLNKEVARIVLYGS